MASEAPAYYQAELEILHLIRVLEGYKDHSHDEWPAVAKDMAWIKSLIPNGRPFDEEAMKIAWDVYYDSLI